MDKTPLRNKLKNNLDCSRSNSTPIKIPPSPFMKSLGFGTGVIVYRLERSPKKGLIESPWAVKRVSNRILPKNCTTFNERIRKEADVLRKLKHPNIVGFRGITRDESGKETLALECCSNSLGDILEQRFDCRENALPAKQILKMILDISCALDYLHTEAKILHGDIKSHNVLVKGDFDICKLCDFGVSLQLDSNGEIDFGKNPHIKYIGTCLWSAPEIIEQQTIINSKADIFSFGLVIYESIALVPPHTVNSDLTDEKSSIAENDNISMVGNCEKKFENKLATNEVTGEKFNLSQTEQNSNEDMEEQTELNANNTMGSEKERTMGSSTIDALEYSAFVSTIGDNSGIEDSFDFPAIPFGSRPLLPNAFELSEDYNLILELFYCCTNEYSEDRPTAKHIHESLQIPASLNGIENSCKDNQAVNMDVDE